MDLDAEPFDHLVAKLQGLSHLFGPGGGASADQAFRRDDEGAKAV